MKRDMVHHPRDLVPVMPNPSTPPSNRSRRIIGVAIVLCSAAVAGIFLWPTNTATSPAPAVVNAPDTREQGRATPAMNTRIGVAEDVPATAAPETTGPNGADLIKQALGLCRQLTSADWAILRDEPWTRPGFKPDPALLAKFRPILDKIREAVASKSFRWDTSPQVARATLTALEDLRGPMRYTAEAAAIEGRTDDVLDVLKLHNRYIASFEGSMLAVPVSGAEEWAIDFIARHAARFEPDQTPELLSYLDSSSARFGPGLTAFWEGTTAWWKEGMTWNEWLEATDFDSAIDDIEKERLANATDAVRDAAIQQMKQILKQTGTAVQGSAAGLERWLNDTYRTSGSQHRPIIGQGELGWLLDSARNDFVRCNLVMQGLIILSSESPDLTRIPDPETGRPFKYTETEKGFILESAAVRNNKPVSMEFTWPAAPAAP